MRGALDIRWDRARAETKRRRDLKERAIQHCGGKCVLCGYSRSPVALEFHHLDPSKKDGNVSAFRSWAKVVAEIKETILVCANCHREIHDGLHPGYGVLPGMEPGDLMYEE